MPCAVQAVRAASALILLPFLLTAGPTPPLGTLPLAFESAGSGASEFAARGIGYPVGLKPAEAIFGLDGYPLRMRLVGASRSSIARAERRLPGVSHYFTGSDSSRWRRNIPRYAAVRYSNVWPGIDIVYHGERGTLEYDFILSPRADPRSIVLEFDASAPARLDPSGDLILPAPGGEVRFLVPAVFQGSRSIRASYVLHKGRVTFKLAAYDRARPVTIDPAIVYSTLLGGNGAASGGSDWARAIALDPSGNIYIAGYTQSRSFPVSESAYQKAHAGGYDSFLVKLNPDASAVLWATYLGGQGWDEALALAVSPSGQAFIAGRTTSEKFPVTESAFQSRPGGSYDAFAASFDSEGRLVYSTLLGGTGDDVAQAIALDAEGNAVLTGYTTSQDFPATSGALQKSLVGGRNAFAAKFDPTGGFVLFATYLGAGDDEGRAVALDSAGRIIIAGQSAYGNFPVKPGAARTRRSMSEGFIVLLDGWATGIEAATYAGGNLEDSISTLTVDGAGNIWVAGQTRSTDLPATADAPQAKSGGAEDAFVELLSPSLDQVLFATYLGGANSETASGLALDPWGNLVLTGSTNSDNLPITEGAPQTARGGLRDGFVALFEAGSNRLFTLTYAGGAGDDIPQALAMHSDGVAHIAGYTASANLRATEGALQPALASGGYDGFLMRMELLCLGFRQVTFLGGAGVVDGEEAYDIAVDSEGNAYIAGRTYSTNFPATQGAPQTSPAALVTSDAFAAKISPDGRTLLWATYFGGNGADSANGIAVDQAGRVTIVGATDSPDLPVTQNSIQPRLAGPTDAFVARFAVDGSALDYSTYLGGTGNDTANAVAVSAAGAAFVTGQTGSRNFTTTEGAANKSFVGGVFDAFACRISEDGAALAWSTYIGSPSTDNATSITLDAAGNPWIAGNTDSPNFQVTSGAAQAAIAGAIDGIAVKLDGGSGGLLYATYFGGKGIDYPEQIRLDAAGNIFLAGGTGSPELPGTENAPQKTSGGNQDAFLAKFTTDGSRLLWSTFLGGVTTDHAYGLAVDAAGNAYIAGRALTFNFPATEDRLQLQSGGPPDAFIAKYDPEGKSLLYSSLLGGGGNDTAYALALDGAGNIWAAGATSSQSFLTTAGAAQRKLAGQANAFVAKYDFTKPTVRLTPAVKQVVNHASGLESIAPGSVIVISGENLAPDEVKIADPLERRSGTLPLTVAGVTVMYVRGNRGMPLFSVSPSKIIAQVPYGALGIEELYVMNDYGTSARARFGVSANAIGIYSVWKADGTPASKDSPFRPGDPMVIRLTGAGVTQPAVSSGQAAPDSPPFVPRESVLVQIEQGSTRNMLDVVQEYRLVPGMVGVADIKVKIHDWVSADSDEWDLSITSGGGWSNKLKVYIKSPQN